MGVTDESEVSPPTETSTEAGRFDDGGLPTAEALDEDDED